MLGSTRFIPMIWLVRSCHEEGSRCGRSFKKDAKESPFCTERCRLLDLRNWLEGNHHLPAEEALPGS
jgi:endogenous inhibitor of DNA gyrase (YacG/DUF329 family)